MNETVNTGHNLILVASELDDSSERIINYLVEEHAVSINAVFFRFLRDGTTELLGRAWLRDPEQTIERAESRKAAPWSGQWFVDSAKVRIGIGTITANTATSEQVAVSNIPLHCESSQLEIGSTPT